MSSGRALEVQHLKWTSFWLQSHFHKCALDLHFFLLPTFGSGVQVPISKGSVLEASQKEGEYKHREGYQKQGEVQIKCPLPTDLGVDMSFNLYQWSSPERPRLYCLMNKILCLLNFVLVVITCVSKCDTWISLLIFTLRFRSMQVQLNPLMTLIPKFNYFRRANQAIKRDREAGWAIRGLHIKMMRCQISVWQFVLQHPATWATQKVTGSRSPCHSSNICLSFRSSLSKVSCKFEMDVIYAMFCC